jgi:GntR family transcriptional regulator of arabinose operon
LKETYPVQKPEKDSHAFARYSQILAELRWRIHSGDLKPGARLPPEQELAQHYRCSRGTLRQAVGILVNEGLLVRIQGSGTFVPQSPSIQRHKPPFAQRFQKSIGLVLDQADDELNREILLGVEQIVKSRGYDLKLAFAEEHIQKFAPAIMRLQACTVGLIILPIRNAFPDASLEQLNADRFPFVLVERYLPEMNCDYVVSDNVGGGYRATEHLLLLGHRSIGFVSSSQSTRLPTSLQDRYKGYRNALKEYGLPYDESLISHDAPSLDSEPPNLYDMLVTMPDRPSAFFAVHDSIALGLLKAAHRHHIRVPEELALVGFGNVSYAAHLCLPLTTIAQQRAELGIRAATLLINRIESQVVGSPKQIELPTDLIIRHSCGAHLRVTRSLFDEAK